MSGQLTGKIWLQSKDGVGYSMASFCGATDTQIDRLVYDLYGRTENEIKIVEDAG
jgi:hypothetical protein